MKQWCDHCDMERADYRVTYRTDKYLPKWSSPNGEQYVAKVCLDCYKELAKEEESGEIWSTSTRYIVG